MPPSFSCQRLVPAASKDIINDHEKHFKANKGGRCTKMIPWWAMLIAFIAGTALGLFMVALLIAEEGDDRP